MRKIITAAIGIAVLASGTAWAAKNLWAAGSGMNSVFVPVQGDFALCLDGDA